jgi:hypothetical protein
MDARFGAMLFLVFHLLGDLLEIGSRSAHFAASLFYNRISRGPKRFVSSAFPPISQNPCVCQV